MKTPAQKRRGTAWRCPPLERRVGPLSELVTQTQRTQGLHPKLRAATTGRFSDGGTARRSGGNHITFRGGAEKQAPFYPEVKLLHKVPVKTRVQPQAKSGTLATERRLAVYRLGEVRSIPASSIVDSGGLGPFYAYQKVSTSKGGKLLSSCKVVFHARQKLEVRVAFLSSPTPPVPSGFS